jgi:hypothetical protein
MRIGRKVYYELSNGNVVLDTGEREGFVTYTTVDEDFQTYNQLKERVRESVGVIELEYGELSEDFAQCSGYRINLETTAIEFSYDPPNTPEPTYQRPLTEQVKELESRLNLVQNAMDEMLLGGL